MTYPMKCCHQSVFLRNIAENYFRALTDGVPNRDWIPRENPNWDPALLKDTSGEQSCRSGSPDKENWLVTHGTLPH